MLVGPTDGQLEQLREQFPESVEERLADGRMFVRVLALPLPVGWSQPSTEMRFITPLGYPVAKPDCFFAERTLRLHDGALPRNTRETEMPEFGGEAWLWFSWHLVTWKPGRNSYLTFVRSVEQRLAEAA